MIQIRPMSSPIKVHNVCLCDLIDLIVNWIRVCDLYCKQYRPRSDCLGIRSLIRVHRVILHDKICFGEN